MSILGGIGKFLGGLKGLAVWIFKRKWLVGLVAIFLSITSAVIEGISNLDLISPIIAFATALFSFNISIIEKVNIFRATEYALSLGYLWQLFELFLAFAPVYLVVWIVYRYHKGTATGNSVPYLNIVGHSIFLIFLLHAIFILAVHPPMPFNSPEDCKIGIQIPCSAYQFIPFSGPVYSIYHWQEIFRPFTGLNVEEAIDSTFPAYSNLSGGRETFISGGNESYLGNATEGS